MKYIVSGPALGKLLQENRIRISRGELVFTPVAVPATAVDTKDVPEEDSKDAPAADSKEEKIEDSKEVVAEDSKDAPAEDTKEVAPVETKSPKKGKK